MSWTTYHCHTPFCDGQSDMESMVLEAIRKKDSIIGFSTHGPVPFASDWNISSKDLHLYYQKLEALKSAFGDQIKIYSGMEADFIENSLNAHSKSIFPEKLDYIISSLHYMGILEDGTPWAVDSYLEEWEVGLKQLFDNNVDIMIQEFSRQSIKMMEEGGFDIVGHVDKVFQNGHLFYNENHPAYRNGVLDMLHAAKENDLIVEINTKSYETLGFFYPHQSFFAILKQLNIPVTINSDAHSTDRLHAGVAAAAEYLLAHEINETVELVKGEWKHCQLTKSGIII